MKSTSLMRLGIRNAQYYAYHGVKTEEKKIGGKYEIDIDLWYNATNAVLEDKVSDAINYEEALFIVSEVLVGEEQYDLIETICNEIANSLMEKFISLEKVRCVVRKYTLPIRHIVSHMEAEQTIERT